jgi:glutaredoxin 3
MLQTLMDRLLGQRDDRVQATIEIYTWQTCPYCIRAKLLLWWKGAEFTEYKIDGDEAARQHMTDRAAGRRSVPQIFINDQHVGGCDDIHALNARGELDALLEQSAPSV